MNSPTSESRGLKLPVVAGDRAHVALITSAPRADEEDEMEEEDIGDFDPYLFMKLLPSKSLEEVQLRLPAASVFRRSPHPRCTLVLDLDETLVHSQMEPSSTADYVFDVELCGVTSTVYAKSRPYLEKFMAEVSTRFEIVVFTASHRAYAETLLNRIDPTRERIHHRLFRDSCATVDGLYLKDLDVLGRDLAQVAIVDNTPYVFAYQPDNAIPIESWYDDPEDTALLDLLPLLYRLESTDDVRPILRDAFHLSDKIRHATDPTQQFKSAAAAYTDAASPASSRCCASG